ncbi:hypothetical protein PSAC2689_30555 [Paraburkholderia sacchari]
MKRAGPRDHALQAYVYSRAPASGKVPTHPARGRLRRPRRSRKISRASARGGRSARAPRAGSSMTIV